MSANKKIILIIVVLAIAGGLTWLKTHKTANAKEASTRKPQTPVVELIQPRIESAPVELTALGQVVSAHTVNVQPQVSGTMSAVYFTEGQTVSAGQKLFLIDPAPYQSLVAQQRAQLERDRAALVAAKSQVDRLAPLAAKEFVTPQEFENARAAAAQAEAVVEGDAAQLATAQINLDRTLVHAPIAGRTGSLAVKTGNIVGPSDALPALVINQLDPIQVEFSVPQSALSSVQAALATGPVPVRVTGEAAGPVLAEGKLVFVDNGVDTVTGTVKLKAEFDNHDKKLWPGTFAAVTLVLSVQQNAVLLPEKAVQQGAAGSFVFVVGDDHKVSLQNVTVDRQLGSDVIISSGLVGSENVVAKAPRNLTAGMTVKTGTEQSQAQGQSESGTPAQEGEHGKRHRQ